MASTATYGAPRTLRAVSTPSQRRTASALHPPFASSCCPAQRGAQDLPMGGGTAAAVLAPGIGDRPRPRSEGTRGGTRPAPAAGPFAPRRRITRFKAELCALSPSLWRPRVQTHARPVRCPLHSWGGDEGTRSIMPPHYVLPRMPVRRRRPTSRRPLEEKGPVPLITTGGPCIQDKNMASTLCCEQRECFQHFWKLSMLLGHAVADQKETKSI